jgi:hypothetical protein
MQRGNFKHTQKATMLVKTDITDTENTHKPNNDQVDGNNIIEQFWLNQNEYAGKQRYKRSQGQIHGVSFAKVEGGVTLASMDFMVYQNNPKLGLRHGAMWRRQMQHFLLAIRLCIAKYLTPSPTATILRRHE